MPVDVFGITLRTHFREGLPQKIVRLFKQLQPETIVAPHSLWAIKLHFGEQGSHAFIRPHLLRGLTGCFADLDARPFLTDTNTLYVGGRTNAADHLKTASQHGFGPAATRAPVIIADGLTGTSEVAVEVNRGGVSTAWIASGLAAADGLLVFSHVKGHELTGFGGALKNLGMGGASRRGKLDQHSDLSPKISGPKCVGCGRCASFCAHQAIRLVKKKAAIDTKKCVGCAGCIPVCPEGAIDVQWDSDAPKFMKKMVEYAGAVARGKEGRLLYINFIGALSPLCDCCNHSDAPIVPDLGFLASRDPVALDLASAELVNQLEGLPHTALAEAARPAGADKWEALYPGCQWRYQLEYAASIGLGSLDYKLTWLPEAKGVA